MSIEVLLVDGHAETCRRITRAADRAGVELSAPEALDPSIEPPDLLIADLAVFRAARPGGRLLPIGFAGGGVPQIPANILMVKNLTVIGFYWGGWLVKDPSAFSAALSRIFGWIAEGKLRPQVTPMPLEQGEEALNMLRSRKAVGKIVLTP